MNTQRLINLLEDHGFSVKLVAGGTELVIACPLCFDDNPRLYLSTETGLWICHRCQAKGHLRSFLIEVCEMSFTEAVTVEKSLVTGKRTRPALITPRPAPPSSVELPQGFMLLGEEVSYNMGAIEYLEQRGVSLDTARELGMGFCMLGPYHHRIIIPVYTQGELRTFVARTWVEGESKKVLMPSGSQAERALFGYDRDTIKLTMNFNTFPLYIVEGVFDAMRMWSLGYQATIATLGSHITPLQQALVKRLRPSTVILLRDGDAPGRNAAVVEARQLAYDIIPVSIANLPLDGTDPGSATPEEIREALDNAKPVELDYGIESQMEVHRGRRDDAG